MKTRNTFHRFLFTFLFIAICFFSFSQDKNKTNKLSQTDVEKLVAKNESNKIFKEYKCLIIENTNHLSNDKILKLLTENQLNCQFDLVKDHLFLYLKHDSNNKDFIAIESYLRKNGVFIEKTAINSVTILQ